MSMVKESESMNLQWPIEDIVSFAKRYAITHGLVCLTPDNLDSATIVPFSLFPSPYSYSHFKFIWSIQTAYNRLYNRISLDDELLEKALSSVIPLDDFIARLWKIHRESKRRQPVQLDIYRNDYMLDTKVDKMRQVEFNTISAAFAGLTGRVADLHKAILHYAVDNCHIREVNMNEKQQQENSSTIDLILPNSALNKLAEAMIKAFELYNNENACILFIIVPNERNVCDQNAIIDAVQKIKPNIRFYLKTLEQLTHELLLDESNYNIYLKSTNDEIAIVYYRAAYIPDHYINEQCWLVREQIEQSRAIKCPTIRSQLAGSKIVQVYLTRANIIEKYINDENLSASIRSTFASMFTFDDEKTREQNINLLCQNPHAYVLKPNREGGGNNKYDKEILTVIEKEKDHLNYYIAMEKILPPQCTTCLIKPNNKHVLHAQCINEIGIYGTMVANVDTNEEYINEVTGYLVRTKTTDTNEGGVATGYSVLDCLDVSDKDNELAKVFSQKL